MKIITIFLLLTFISKFSHAKNTPELVTKQIVQCVSVGNYACFWDFLAPSAKYEMAEQLKFVKSTPFNIRQIEEKYGIKSDALLKMGAKEYTIALFSVETADGKNKNITISKINYSNEKNIAFVETDNNGVKGNIKLQMFDGNWKVVF